MNKTILTLWRLCVLTCSAACASQIGCNSLFAAPTGSHRASEQRPCAKPEYREFDFWVGDWEVVDPNGKPLGHNLITVEQDGCLLVEHWASKRGGHTGTSFNYYDIRDKKWHQLFLDNSGDAGAFPAMAGGLVGDKMILLTDARESPLFRWTWYVTGPGRVRQMAEQSDDAAKTWKAIWDSTYVRGAQKCAAKERTEERATPTQLHVTWRQCLTEAGPADIWRRPPFANHRA
jgi:hypothetical protein